MAFKMRYGKEGPPMYDKSFATKYGHDKGPTFNTELRKEAMDPNTTMNEGFREKVLSSNTMRTHMYKHGGTKPQSQMTEEELAKHKGIKNPQANAPSQGDEPAFPGGDISRKDWNSMTKRQKQNYMKNNSEDMS